MSLLANLDNDIKDAMRAKQMDKLNVLRMLKSAIKYASIEKHGADAEASDAEFMQVAQKEIKKRHDSVAAYEKIGKADAADKERAEISIIKGYLPKELPPDEAKSLAKSCVEELGAKTKADMGPVMKLAREKAAGRIDGKTLSHLVQELLK
ncbi:MAG: GatB/YqeY domain-containing protein [Verrucomicrobiota bacterium]